MLTKQLGGKQHTNEWERKRSAALVDSTHLTVAEKDWLDITGSEGLTPKTVYQQEVRPIDARTRGKKAKLDMRNRPEAGGI